jgi:branched-chain amino acid transport system permease protein
MVAYLMHVATYFLVYAVLALGCNLILGYAGLWHIGFGAFFAIGAYTGAILGRSSSLPFLLAFLASGVVAGVVGFIFTATLVTENDDYFSVATFAFGTVIYVLLANWRSLTNGVNGITGIATISILGVKIARGWPFLLLMLAFCSVMFLIIYLVVKSPYGRALKAMRDDNVGLGATGRSTPSFKMWVNALGGFLAGLTGCLFAHYSGFVDPSGYTTDISFLVMAMVVVGGMGTLWGPVLGAFVLVAVPEMLRFVGLPSTTGGLVRQGLYGLLLVLILFWKPSGLLGKRASVSRRHSRSRPGAMAEAKGEQR